MTKNELVSQIAENTGLTKVQAESALSSTISAITNSLSNGNEVRLVGFGTFKISERQARQGRNPQTGATINIPASKVPTFKAGKDLREAVR